MSFNSIDALQRDVAHAQAIASTAGFILDETEPPTPVAEVLADGSIKRACLLDVSYWDADYWS